MADVAVGEDDRLRPLVTDEPLELRLGHDRDALRIEGPRQLGRIGAAGDARDLRRREGHHVARGIVAVDDVEVMEVPPRGTHDHDSRAIHVVCLLSVLFDGKPWRASRGICPGVMAQAGDELGLGQSGRRLAGHGSRAAEDGVGCADMPGQTLVHVT